jgi:hypothetical protein
MPTTYLVYYVNISVVNEDPSSIIAFGKKGHKNVVSATIQ